MVKASSLASLAMSEVSAAFAAVVAQDAQKKTASQGLAATDARREMLLPERESRCRNAKAVAEGKKLFMRCCAQRSQPGWFPARGRG